MTVCGTKPSKVKAIKIWSNWGGTSQLLCSVWKSQFCQGSKVGEMVWELGRGQYIFKCGERTGEGVEGKSRRRTHVLLSPSFPPSDLIMGMNFLRRPDFSLEPSCHWMGLPFPVTINSSPLHASLGSSRRSHNSGEQKQRPAGWIPLRKGAVHVGHASTLSLMDRFLGTNRMAVPLPAWPGGPLTDKLDP